MTIKEERNMILTMIAEGKISAEEGDLLLQALEQSERNIEEELRKQRISTTTKIPVGKCILVSFILYCHFWRSDT